MESKATIEKDIEAIQQEKQVFDKEVASVKEYLLKLFEEEKVDFVSKFDQYDGKLEKYLQARIKMDESRKSLIDELEALKQFLKTPPGDAKKSLKNKQLEKLDSQTDTLKTKLNAEQKKRNMAGEKFDDLFKDMSALRQVLKS